ncbi:MAG: CopY/TcrY family copper transport repressor [Erysipelothrix sp.]|nr:CopY/TcrY family copper transport repressor [Erysipelothrix sp.]
MKNLVEISGAEWEVMKVIWSLEEATSKSVGQVLKEKQNWESPTTKTLLGRLVKKGYLETEKVGNYFIYHPTISESEGSSEKISEAVASVCSRKVGASIAKIIEENQLSKADFELITKALANKDLVDNVKCKCLGDCACAEGQCTCN